MNFDEKYEQFKKTSRKEGFYCPKKHELASAIANTPLFLRRWFKKNG